MTRWLFNRLLGLLLTITMYLPEGQLRLLLLRWARGCFGRVFRP